MVTGFVVLSSQVAYAAANLSPSTSFTPADSSRTSMDIGGAWNGSLDVTATTGDTFSITLTNNGDVTATGITGSVTLPAGFLYVANTASGIASLTATQVGTTLTFNIPGGTTIAASSFVTLNFGLVTSTSVVAGTFQLNYNFSYNSGLTLGPVEQDVLVTAGASILTFNPLSQTKSVNQTAAWDITVTNTGLGGLFNVPINESLINPNTAHSLQITSIVQTFPVSPVATGSLPTLTIPYLATGSSFTVHVVANVTGCLDITNTASTNDRTTLTSKTNTAQVVLNLAQPLITYTPLTTTLHYGSTVTESFLVQNTGLGDALSVVLGSNLPSLGVTISNVAAGWSYNSGTGDFTHAATIANGANSTLSFDLLATAICTTPAGGTEFWTSNYTNGCGAAFTTPTPVSSLAAPSNTPSLTLTKTAADPRVKVGTSSSYTLNLTAANTTQIQTDPVLVHDVLPTGISSVVLTPPGGTSANCSGSCVAGSTITWSIPLSQLPGPLALLIGYTAPSDPCLGGSFLVNTSSVAAASTQSCSLSSNASASALLINNADAGATYNFDPNPGVHGTTYETGSADDGNGMRDAGEGEFIMFVASYTFGGGYPGTWSGSTYQDNYGGFAGQTYVANTLKVVLDGGAEQSVPGGSILQTVGALRVDLGFVAGLLSDANVASHAIDFHYQTTHADGDLGGSASASVTQLVTLKISGGGGSGSCTSGGNTFTQGAFYTISRAQAAIAVTGVPSVVDACQVFSTTFTITNATAEQASNVLTTALTGGDYDFIVATAPVYGGDFSGNITYTPNGGTNPTFAYVPGSSKISSGGTINFYARRKGLSGTSATALTGQVDFDDVQTSTNASREFTVTGNATPTLVRKANIGLTVTPQSYTVTGSTVEWTIYVTNQGNGVAYGATVSDLLPTAFLPNGTATDAANPGHTVTVSGSSMSWTLGDMTPGQIITIQVIASANGSSCSLPPNSNSITAKWGCGGVDVQTVNTTSPDFVFPSGQLQILHDTTSSFCALCDNGKDIIIIKNSGATHVTNAVISEILNPVTTGLDRAMGTVEYSIDGGNTWNPGSDPTGAGTTASPYQFAPAQVAPLADLSPASEAGTNEVRIRFTLTATETSNTLAPTLTASATAQISCGNPVSSPGTPFSIPVEKPSFVVTKVGKNITTSQASYTGTVYASQGDVVQWQITVHNTGNFKSENTRLTEAYPGTGATSGDFNGPGYTGFTFNNATPIPIPLPTDQIAAGASEVYTVQQTLGASCVNQNNSADVTWGCVNNGTNSRSNLSSPSSNTGTSPLVLIPDFSGSGISQVFTPLPSGRTEVAVTITNNGGTAQTLVLTDTLPSGQQIDTTFTPTISSTGGVSGMSVDSSSATQPVFTFTGTMRHADQMTVRFRIVQLNGFDTTACRFNFPESTHSCDPTPPAVGNNVAALTYDSTCAQAGSASSSVSLSPPTPNVDMTVSPATQVLQAGNPYTYTFTLVNSGRTGSIADNIIFTPTVGSGFSGAVVTVVTPGTSGTGGVCGATCTAAQIGTLAVSQSAIITVAVTALNNGNPTTVLGTVTGGISLDNGTPTGNNYTFDEAQPGTLGFSTSKTFVSQGESFTTYPNVPIGGEITWRLNSTWFGNDPASGLPISTITVRDSFPAGLGFVSYALTGSNTMSIISVSTPVPVSSGTVNFILGPTTSSGTFEANIVARVLNVAGNTDGASLINSLGNTFYASSSTFASNSGLDGFGGTFATLHAQDTITVKAPIVATTKLVKNVTRGSGFASSQPADGGDNLQYQLTLTNNGHAPAYDLSASDVFGTTKLTLIDDSGGASGGTFDVSQGSVTFNEGNTPFPLGQSLTRLDPSQTVTLTYRATVNSNVVPNDALANDVSFVATSLPGASSNETSPIGVPGTSSGERVLTSTAAATLDITTLVFTKSLVSGSVATVSLPHVVIGEQVRYRITTQVPGGTSPNFKVLDALPSGLALIQTFPVTFGSGISPQTQPSITPSSLPTASSATVTWDFGTLTVSTGASAGARTMTFDYLARVRDIVTTGVGIALLNDSSYTYTGSVPVNESSVTVTAAEPNLRLAVDTPAGGSVVLGTPGTFTVRVDNPTGANVSPGYQPTIQLQLPADLRATDPTTLPVTAALSGGRTLTFAQNTDYTLSYSSTTGTLIYAFTSAASYVNLGETLTLTFQAALKETSVDSSTSAVVGTITQSYSADTSAGVPTDVRQSTTTFGTGSLGTANAATGDDRTDDAQITERRPTLFLTKSVNKTIANPAVDTALQYSIAVYNSGSVPTSTSTVLVDDLGSFAESGYFISGSLAGVSVTGATSFTDASNALGGTQTKGLVRITNFAIPAVSTATVSFNIGIAKSIPNETLLTNQAMLTAAEFSATFVSNIATTTVKTGQAFDIYKFSVVNGTTTLVPGGFLTYTIVLHNRSSEIVQNAVLTDAAPPNTAYVPNTTTLNGNPVADSGNLSPLTSGLTVETPPDAAGQLRICPSTATSCTAPQEATVRFQVQVSSLVAPGTRIANQALLTGQGLTSGTSFFMLSDDTATTPSPDPTVNIVGGGSYLEAEKTVSDLTSSTGTALDTLLYTITVHNRGSSAATAVKLTDAMPAHTTYIPSSLQYDASGAGTSLSALTDSADSDQGDFNITSSSAITLSIGTLARGAQVILQFRVQINAGTANGTILSNQATITATGLADKQSDGDGNHSNGDQPTLFPVGAGPALRQIKTVIDPKGGAVAAGDILEYDIQTFNIGLTSATNLVITDTGPAPAQAYVPNSTSLNGVTVTDVGGASKLLTGINTGSLASGASNLVRFRVTLSTTLANGAIVINQGTYAADGGLTGVSQADTGPGATIVQIGGSPGSAQISGYVWIDTNHDRIFDLTEVPQYGWIVEILSNGQLIDTATTDAAGFYQFKNLTPGSGYQVRFRNPITHVVYGRAITQIAGADTSDGTLRGLTLISGENSLNNSLPLDPSGIVYNSVTRAPIAGAILTISGPAGFDPAIHLLPNQQGQITGADGLYRFDINFAGGAPFGVYTLQVTPPAGYTTQIPTLPSGVLPPSPSVACASTYCFDVPSSTLVPVQISPYDAPPTGSQPAVYYLRFKFDDLNAGNVIDNHLPLDPILKNAITVTKVAKILTASKGDMVPYTVTATNNFAIPLSNIDLVDLMPAGLKYVHGSATLNGERLEPTTAGRTLTWPNLSFVGNETKTFQLILIIGSGVGEGEYVNQAWANNNLVGYAVSNVAAATIKIVPDATFDCPDVIGKVFDDTNANGYQDEGEVGVPGVRIVSTRGELYTTDADGRFHVVCPMIPDPLRGSNYLMKVDPRTLPTGYRFTTENPRDVHLTRGKVSKLNFGVALFQVVRLDLSPDAYRANANEPTSHTKIIYVPKAERNIIPPVHFAVAKFSLRAEDIDRIKEAYTRVKALQDVRHVRIKVVGHTDSSIIHGRLAKKISGNWALSKDRANAVAAYLRNVLDLPKESVWAVGVATTQPVATNSTEEGRAQNRRVEVHVVYEQKKEIEIAQSSTTVVAQASAAPAHLPWEKSIDEVMEILKRKPSILRIAYCQGKEPKAQAKKHINEAARAVETRWKDDDRPYTLSIEKELNYPSCEAADEQRSGP